MPEPVKLPGVPVGALTTSAAVDFRKALAGWILVARANGAEVEEELHWWARAVHEADGRTTLDATKTALARERGMM